MKSLKKIPVENLQHNVFQLIGDKWMLITAGKENEFNTMTASWGGLGVLWNKNVATIFVRPQRYTYQFIEKNEIFTLSFFSEEHRNALKFCGKYSGRDFDKIKETGLEPEILPGSGISFTQSELILECKKIYFNDLNPENFLTSEIEKNYPAKDYHRMYISEILNVYIRG